MRQIVRALLVEDNQGDLGLTSARLDETRHARFHLEDVRCLSDALKWLSQYPCDVVLLDLNLPDATGLETLRQVRLASKQTPIVVVSGALDERTRAEALDLGAEEIIGKDDLKSRLFPSTVLAVVERSRSRAHHKQLTAVLDATPDGMVVVDEKGVIKYLNNQALALFGRRREELIDERLVFAAPPGAAVELRLIRPDGERVGEMRVSEFEWLGERAFLAAVRDVTHQRNMEMQLLTSDRLVSLGTLAAGVAHEINNPLAAVLANVDLALRDAASLPDASFMHRELVSELRDAREAAERIRHIVRDLKVFSRTEEDSRDAVDVQRILDSVARMAGNEIRHRARLVKDYQPVPTVLANESRLSQVFLNLLVNAAQAIPEGNAEENEIRIVTRAGSEGRVFIDIKDTGCGIPEGVRARLFTPFFTTKPVGSGTGIGLAICQRIVRAFGGELSFKSQVGEGTCFTVGLPSAEVQAVPELRPAPATPAPQPRRRGRLLVVDDDAMIIQSLRRILSGQHDLVCLDNAHGALGLLRQGQRFDVILCDLMMPEVTGMEFCGQLSELDPEQARRVVLMTGGAFTAQAREFLDASVYPRVDKPFDVQGLRALLNSLVG